MTTQTAAEQAVIALRAINPETAATALDGSDMSLQEWDTIRRFDVDDRATEEADPANMSTVAIFADGSAIRYLEDQGRWTVEL